MPLRDHFHPPLSDEAPWPSLHGAWATFLMQQLNEGVLPAGYVAAQHVYVGDHLQVDVATLERGRREERAGGGTVATAATVWAPPAPPVVLSVDLSGLDVTEVRVSLAGGRRLVAAVELVSPANKDRPGHQQAFAAKVGGYLRQQVGVVVVDVVTERQDSLHEELLRLLDAGEAATDLFTADLYAVAYRAEPGEGKPRLEAWPEALAIGAPLPRLPLWIGPERAVPLDLEAGYTAACRASGLRESGDANGRPPA